MREWRESGRRMRMSRSGGRTVVYGRVRRINDYASQSMV